MKDATLRDRDRVEKYVRRHPGCQRKDIAKGLKLTPARVKYLLRRQARCAYCFVLGQGKGWYPIGYWAKVNLV